MNLFYYLLFFWFFSFLSFGQKQKESVLELRALTLTNANAVILNDETDINLISQTHLEERRVTKTLILNSKADKLANPVIYYDNHTKIIRLIVKYFSLDGRLLKKIVRSDFRDLAASGNSTLYSDNRVLYYDYTPTVYPFIVKLEYHIRSGNTAFITPWFPYPDYNVAVQKSVYSFTYPTGFKLYTLEKRLKPYNIIVEKNQSQISYIANNLAPLVKEPYSPAFEDLGPYVRLAVNKFQLAGVKGTANSWKDFGIWMYQKLLRGRAQLPQATVDKVRNLVKNTLNPAERAKIIYEYVQNKTRYINVAIGIGGWQPMPASEVDQLGYGDCKALTNYTKALLDAVHVDSYYTIAYAGDHAKDINNDLIGIQGNHVLLCIPQKNDSIWLECTSQKLPFNFVDSFTDNRQVLTITPQGGKLVKTKVLKPVDNYQLIKADYQILDNGDLNASINIKSYGDQYIKHLQHFDGKTIKELENEFSDFFNELKNVEFIHLDTKNNKQQKFFKESIRLKSKEFAHKFSDTALIFTPNAFNRSAYVPPRISEKKYPFVINRGYKDEDVYTINIPANYTFIDLPESVDLQTDFGSYHLSYRKITPNKIKYHRIFILKQGFFPKASYTKYRKFRKKIKKLDKQKLLINKKTFK